MPNRNRRLIAGVAASLAALATLTACTGGAPGAPQTPAADEKPSGTLEVWVRAANDSVATYQMIFDAFKEKTGVEITSFATNTDFETKLNAAAAARDLPDVVINDASQVGNMMTQGVIQPIDKATIAGGENLSDKAWSSVTTLDGQTYGVPTSAQANVLLIRTDWLEKVGMKAPTTWDEFVAVAKAFTEQDPDGNGKADTYGVAIPGSTERGYLAWNWSSYLWQAGGDFVKVEGEKVTPAIDSPEALEAANLFKNLFCEAKVVQPGALSAPTSESNQAWYTGVAGMYLTGPYAYNTSDTDGLTGKYTAVAPPKGPDNSDVLAEGTTLYFMSGSKNPTAAKAFAEFMITPQAQEIGMVGNPKAAVVRLPVNQNVDAGKVRGDDEKWALAQKVYTESAHYEPNAIPQWQALRQATADALNASLVRCGDMAPALTTANDQFKQALARS